MTTEDNEKHLADMVGIMEAANLVGDVRDVMIEQIKHHTEWSKIDEGRQESIISSLTIGAKHLVNRAVQIIAAEDREVLPATVKTVQSDGEAIKATLAMPSSSEHRHALFDAAGARVLVAVVDASQYQGEKEPAKADPDEPALFDQTKAGEQIDTETGEITEAA